MEGSFSDKLLRIVNMFGKLPARLHCVIESYIWNPYNQIAVSYRYILRFWVYSRNIFICAFNLLYIKLGLCLEI